MELGQAVVQGVAGQIMLPDCQASLLAALLAWWQRLPASLARRLAPCVLRMLNPHAEADEDMDVDGEVDGMAIGPLQILACDERAWANPSLVG